MCLFLRKSLRKLDKGSRRSEIKIFPFFSNDCASHCGTNRCRLQFRVALLLKLSQHNPEPIVSAPVVITTLAAGLPTSPPRIVRGSAVDSYRVSVSWEPGEFVNGPLLSYVLRLQWDNHTQLKVYATPELFILKCLSHVLRACTSSTSLFLSFSLFLSPSPLSSTVHFRSRHFRALARRVGSQNRHALPYYLTVLFTKAQCATGSAR